jgi:hypothetical protein
VPRKLGIALYVLLMVIWSSTWVAITARAIAA